MLTVVVYDISDNTSRSYLIKKLQHFGLKRIQKSVFIGYLEAKERLDKWANAHYNSNTYIETYLSKDTDSIIILPSCESCKNSSLLVGDAEIPQNNLTYRFLWELSLMDLIKQ